MHYHETVNCIVHILWSPIYVPQSRLLIYCFFGLAGQNIRKLVKDGFIIKKPQKIHSRSRARRAHEAKQKGRHSGYGILVFCVKSCSAA
jgi:hypothetical protein